MPPTTLKEYGQGEGGDRVVRFSPYLNGVSNL